MKSCNIYATEALHGDAFNKAMMVWVKASYGQDRSLRAFKRYSQRCMRPERPRKEPSGEKEFK
jgi:hypothetical protein